MTLTGRHIFWLMFTFELGDMILLTVSPTIQDAKQDAWISHILGTFIAFFIVYIAVKVGQQFPKDSFVQYTKKLVGSFLGVIIIILYIVQWLTVVPLILVETANFINTILLPQTLTSIIYLLIIFLLIYIMYSGGVETIGLISEVFGPLIIISLLIMLILVSNEFHLKYLLPVFNDVSFPAIWKGALNPLSFLGESVIMLMLVYFAKEDAKVLKNALWGMMLSAFLFGTLLVSVLLTFGPHVSAGMLYPVFDMINYIFVMEFIQNVEILAVVVSMLSVFIKLSLYYFLICHTIAHLFNINDWKKVSLYVAPIIFITTISIPNISSVLDFTSTVWIYIVLPLHMVAIPLMLLMIAKVKNVYAEKG